MNFDIDQQQNRTLDAMCQHIDQVSKQDQSREFPFFVLEHRLRERNLIIETHEDENDLWQRFAFSADQMSRPYRFESVR